MPFRSRILCDLVGIGEQLNDPSLLSDVIHIFLEQAPLQAEAINHASLQKDTPVLLFQTHKLKTSSGVIGSEKLQSLCQAIEDSASQEHSQAMVSRLIGDLRREVELECLELLRELNSYLIMKK